MPVVSARAGYALWAATYQGETAVSLLDEDLVQRLSPPLEGRRLLDAGCGTGRRLPPGAEACGIDASWEMLRTGPPPVRVAAADVRALPFADGRFDAVWCRLVIGHLPDPGPVYTELGRVCRPGGTVIVTDFHPEAAAAGHRRTFRDAGGVVREVEHHVHTAEQQRAAADRAGLTLEIESEGRVGPLVRALYEQRGLGEAYRLQLGLPLVLAMRFRRA